VTGAAWSADSSIHFFGPQLTRDALVGGVLADDGHVDVVSAGREGGKGGGGRAFIISLRAMLASVVLSLSGTSCR